MKQLFSLISIIFISYNSISQIDTNQVNAYFNEIAYGNEFDPTVPHHIRKWHTNINIFISGDKQPYMIRELYSIVKELNDLINPIELSIVNDSLNANYFIYLGNEQTFNKIEPLSIKYTRDNLGLFFIKRTEKFKIYHANIFVNMDRTSHDLYRLHILREEMTQALGLINDSFSYYESIFYQGWTFTTRYTELDKQIIKKLYNSN